MQTYKGSCHCQAIQFEVIAPSELKVFRCNCSVCYMKQNHHFVVPQQNLQIIQGQDELQLYQFGTNTARHMFCKICGVQPFYIPRSNPDGYGVTIYCIDTSPSSQIVYEDFDGTNWENAFSVSSISEYSKTS